MQEGGHGNPRLGTLLEEPRVLVPLGLIEVCHRNMQLDRETH